MIAILALKLAERFALSPKLAKLAAWGIALLLAALALYAAYSWAWDRGRDHERAKWEAAAEMLEDADAVADDKARGVASETKEGIDDGNRRAEEAARGSDDPLKSGFDSLRGEGSGKGR